MKKGSPATLWPFATSARAHRGWLASAPSDSATLRPLMPVRSLSLMLGAASLLAGGCGGNVVVDTPGNGGSPTTTTTTTSSSAAGTTSTTSSAATTTSSASGGMPCIGTFNLTLDGDNFGTLLTSVCDAPWNPLMSATPIGYLLEGGPPPGFSDLHVDACAGPVSGSKGVHADAPGAGTPGEVMGKVTYTDGNGGTWTGGAPITIVDIGVVGQQIQGSFNTTVTNGGDAHALSVKFSVCHVPDEEAP